jgi:hypothetical protein
VVGQKQLFLMSQNIMDFEGIAKDVKTIGQSHKMTNLIDQ